MNLVGDNAENVLGYDSANGGALTLSNPWNGDQANTLAGTETTTDLDGIAVADGCPRLR